MKPPTNIKTIVAGGENIQCDICGNPTKETARDTVTPLRAGDCCAGLLIFTDHMLTIHGPKAGIVHPQATFPNA